MKDKINRIFVQNLWMPWDEDSECSDWVSEHLENRLSLHFSLVNGSGDQATAIRLDQLVARAELNRSVSSDARSHINCFPHLSGPP